MGTVESSLHDDDMIAACDATRQPDGRHRGFGARVQDLHHLTHFDICAHQFGQAAFERVGAAAAKVRPDFSVRSTAAFTF